MLAISGRGTFSRAISDGFYESEKKKEKNNNLCKTLLRLDVQLYNVGLPIIFSVQEKKKRLKITFS